MTEEKQKLELFVEEKNKILSKNIISEKKLNENKLVKNKKLKNMTEENNIIKKDFTKMKIHELKDYCRKEKIRGFSKFSKKEKDKIIKLIIKHHELNETSKEKFLDNKKSYITKNINVYLGDCLTKLNNVKDKSVQLVCIDPPYNINKDYWDNINNYNTFIINIIKKIIPKIKDNGSFYMFHNDMEKISELMILIKKETKLKFKQMIVWNKRFKESKKKGFMDGFIVRKELHNYNKMAEYILFYTFDNSYKLLKKRKELKISQLQISKEILSKTGGITGWYSNLETGRNYPTIETIKPIKKHLGLNYDDIVTKYNNKKTHHSVWNYDIAKRCKIHITPKPLELLKNIIYHSSDENDIVLDCFAGSGSMGYACLETNRKCILIEKEEKYYDYIVNNLKNNYE